MSYLSQRVFSVVNQYAKVPNICCVLASAQSGHYPVNLMGELRSGGSRISQRDANRLLANVSSKTTSMLWIPLKGAPTHLAKFP